MTKTKSTQRLTAQRKLELYLATRAPDAPVGEILREYGVHLDDLREIVFPSGLIDQESA